MSDLTPKERITRAFLRTLEQAGLALGGLDAAASARATLETALAQGARDPLWPAARGLDDIGAETMAQQDRSFAVMTIADVEAELAEEMGLITKQRKPVAFGKLFKALNARPVNFDDVNAAWNDEVSEIKRAMGVGDNSPDAPTPDSRLPTPEPADDDTAAMAEGRLR